MMNRETILSLYDTPDPSRPGKTVPGYDREHARRTAVVVTKLAAMLGVRSYALEKLEATALLHDIGRVGMDPKLFGAIFTIAQGHGLPVRLPQLLEAYPGTVEAEAPSLFLKLVRPHIEQEGVEVDGRVVDHIRMRMDFKGRLREVLRERAGVLRGLGVEVEPWMEKVMLYYYYPQDIAGEPEEVRLMGMVLVAGENFEAYNNCTRGRDYYGRRKESLEDAFRTLDGFVERGLVTRPVLDALKKLAASGGLNAVVNEARGLPSGAALPEEDRRFLRRMAHPS